MNICNISLDDAKGEGTYGRCISLENRSQVLKGRKLTDEHIALIISISMKLKRAIGEKNKGHKHTEESKSGIEKRHLNKGQKE